MRVALNLNDRSSSRECWTLLEKSCERKMMMHSLLLRALQCTSKGRERPGRSFEGQAFHHVNAVIVDDWKYESRSFSTFLQRCSHSHLPVMLQISVRYRQTRYSEASLLAAFPSRKNFGCKQIGPAVSEVALFLTIICYLKVLATPLIGPSFTALRFCQYRNLHGEVWQPSQ